MALLQSLALSLALTLLLEGAFALLWGVEREDFGLVALVNVLTNPAVVLCHFLVAALLPQMLLPATLALEAGAVLAEGYLYARRGRMALPWLFALCANLFSYCVGTLLF